MSEQERQDDLRNRISDAFIAFEDAESTSERVIKRKALFWIVEEAISGMTPPSTEGAPS